MTEVSITGVGSYLPPLAHTNTSLPPLDAPVDTEALSRVGVHTRHWADGESVQDMASRAASIALDRAGLPVADLDLVIMANWSQRRHVPDLAPAVAHQLGADAAFAFDIGCACAGFLVGCATAASFLRTGRYTHALVVSAETNSLRGRPGSKATLIFGDAAAAFVLSADEPTHADTGRLIDVELISDGAHHDIMTTGAQGWIQTTIAQRELVTLAATSMAEIVTRLLTRNGLQLSDIDWMIPHSGTAGVQALMRDAVNMAPEKILTNFADVGNVTSASIPLALNHFAATGQVKPGQLILSPVVGAGWYAAGALYTAGGLG